MSESQSNKWYKPILDWLKLNGGDYVSSLILKYGGDFIKSAVGGFWGKVLFLAYKWIAVPLVKAYAKHKKNNIIAKEKLERLNEVIKNPSSTNADIIAAEDNFFNRP